jgi:hypothetical protein
MGTIGYESFRAWAQASSPECNRGYSDYVIEVAAYGFAKYRSRVDVSFTLYLERKVPTGKPLCLKVASSFARLSPQSAWELYETPGIYSVCTVVRRPLSSRAPRASGRIGKHQQAGFAD